MTTRGKVIAELGIITILTAIFLLLFPHRNPLLDVGLAGFALLCIGVSAGYTWGVIWAASPPRPMQNRFKKCVTVTLWITAPTVLLFLCIGGIAAYRTGARAAVDERILNWRLLAVFGGYTVWALMQQTLFQFYLLGRLLVLFPKDQPVVPILVTGISFSFVHLPDIPTMLVTAIAGIVWTALYYRFRFLFPLAISHAALGTAFYYGICGHDLAGEWKDALAALRLA